MKATESITGGVIRPGCGGNTAEKNVVFFFANRYVLEDITMRPIFYFSFRGLRTVNKYYMARRLQGGKDMKELLQKSVLVLAAALLLCGVKTPVFAQDEDTIDLGEITVTATKKPTSVENVSESVEIITEEEIKAMPVENVDDLIAVFAGAMSDRMGGSTEAKGGVKLRGQDTDSGRVLVMVDGMILNNGDSGGANFTMIDMDNVERIEVVRGASSVMHGTNGMGGIINIITKRPTAGDWKGSTEVQAGGRSTYTQKLSLQGSLSQNLTMLFSASNMRSGDYNSEFPEDRDAENVAPENNTIEERHYFLKAVQNLGNADTTVNYSLKVYDDMRFRGEAYNLSNNPNGSAWSFDTQRLQVDVNNPGERSSSRFSLGYNLENYESYSERLRGGRYTHWIVSSDRLNYGFDGSSSWTSNNHDVTLGGGYSLASQDAKDDYLWSNDTDVRNDPTEDAFNKGDLKTLFAYVHDTMTLSDKVDMQLGLRFDDASVEDAMYNLSGSTTINTLTGKGWDHFSPKLGFVFHTGEDTRIRLQYNHAFHAPTLESMTLNLMRGGAFWNSNPSLDPEKSDAYEIGFERNGEDSDQTLSIYYSKAEDFIDVMDCSAAIGCAVGDRKYMNVGEVDFKGVEFENSWDTTPNTRLYFNTSYTDTEIKEYLADTTLVGNQLTMTPKVLGNVGFFYSRDRDESLGVNLSYTGSAYDDSDNTVKQRSYFSADVRASKWISDVEKIEVQANNLFQPTRLAGDRGDYRLPGVLWSIGYTREF